MDTPRLPFLLFALAIVASACAGELEATSIDTETVQAALATAPPAPRWLDDTLFLVGPEEVVLDAQPYHVVDNLVPTHVSGLGVAGYVAAPDGRPSIMSDRYWGPSLDTAFRSRTRLGVVRPAGTLDHCGAWLNSVIPDPAGGLLGFYHGERGCDYVGQYTHKAMFAARSTDGGSTWTSLGRVLDGPAASGYGGGAGDATVVRYGDYMYMFFTDSASWTHGVARSRLSARGLPGTWFRYRREPLYDVPLWVDAGIDNGPAASRDRTFTPIFRGFPGSRVVLNTTEDRFMAIRASARWGFGVVMSEPGDPTRWVDAETGLREVGSRREIHLVPPASGPSDTRVDDWSSPTAPTPPSGVAPTPLSSRLGWAAYTTIVDEDGDSEHVDNEFYLYYVRVPEQRFIYDVPGQPGTGAAHFVRRHITMRSRAGLLGGGAQTIYRALLPLVSYRRASDGKTRTSVEAPLRSGYDDRGQTLGLLSANPHPGMTPLYECNIDLSGWDDPMLVTNLPIVNGRPVCPDAPVVRFVRRLGYLSPTPTDLATVPLVTCFDERLLDHYYVTRVDGCRAGTRPEHIHVLGYLVPRPGTGPLAEHPRLRPLDFATRMLAGHRKTRAITAASSEDSAYTATEPLARVYTQGGAGRVELHECFIALSGWQDYMITSGPRGGFCARAPDEQYRGVIGYLSASRTAEASVPIYSCWNAGQLDHFVSTSSCGGLPGGVIGWAAPFRTPTSGE